MARRVALLVPCFNEGERLLATMTSIAKSVATRHSTVIFLVDDGSSPPVDELWASPTVEGADLKVVLIRHAVNLGQGAALETARRAALAFAPTFDAFVTLDADGQHDPADLERFLEALDAGADAVFGNRFAGTSNVPPTRAALLWFARIFERALTRLPLSDAHNGYRAFNQRAIAAIGIEQNGMAHATEIKQRIAKAQPPLVVKEVPVSIHYSPETLGKGQSSLGALQILRELFVGYFFRSDRR